MCIYTLLNNNMTNDGTPYKATWKSDLLKHIKSIHDGIKFPCDQCDYKATFKVNLLAHIRSKHEK